MAETPKDTGAGTPTAEIDIDAEPHEAVSRSRTLHSNLYSDFF